MPELKLRVLAEVSAAVRPGTLLTSNTSAIPIGELAGALARPEELVGTHFMNPPYLIRTVEVVRGPATGDAALKGVLGLLESLDCRALVVGDGPGFVSNRILMLMINNAARLVDEGRAGAAEVDAVFTGCLGHRTGPLATADLIGLDNVVDTAAGAPRAHRRRRLPARHRADVQSGQRGPRPEERPRLLRPREEPAVTDTADPPRPAGAGDDPVELSLQRFLAERTQARVDAGAGHVRRRARCRPCSRCSSCSTWRRSSASRSAVTS